jgi:methylated-DNA-[protein]-cysteine S-methyltransferase
MFDELDSEVGRIVFITDETQLLALDFEGLQARMNGYLRSRFGEFTLAAAVDPLDVTSRLRAYFDGEYGALDRIAVDPGGTEFQQKVWAALRTIPVGETLSYQQLATRIGKPSACRAVGSANSRNPIGIVIPCHRVIGADGTLTGYAGGLERKRWLLRHEQVSGQLNLLDGR